MVWLTRQAGIVRVSSRAHEAEMLHRHLQNIARLCTAHVDGAIHEVATCAHQAELQLHDDQGCAQCGVNLAYLHAHARCVPG